MRRQYIFLLLIIVILYISYLIIAFKYREYQVNSSIEYIESLNIDITNKIATTEELIGYKMSKAYKNKILKEQQGYKNKGENVVYLMPEERYNIYTQEANPLKEEIINASKQEEINPQYELTIFERRINNIFHEGMKF